MERKIKIFCRNTSEYIDVEGGATLAEVASQLADELTIVPICARVNNKTEDLGFPIYSPKQVEFLDQSSPSGNRVYVRSLCMMLYKAVTEVCPGARLRIEHSISRGYYCRLLDDQAQIGRASCRERVF